jgi:hypothetical protein
LAHMGSALRSEEPQLQTSACRPPQMTTQTTQKAASRDWVSGIDQNAFRAIRLSIQQIADAFKPFRSTIEAIVEQGSRCDRIDSSGWVAHETNVHLVEGDARSIDDVNERVAAYYRENWAQVRQTLTRSVRSYSVDDAAIATYSEALDAHEHGLYRCAPRLLFPEVERVSRHLLHGGQLSGLASQRGLRDLVGGLTPGEISRHGMAGYHFYKRLTSELYAKIETEDDFAQLASKEGALNRHAALHGLITYATSKASINALLICDFLFGAISAIKRRADYEGSLKEPL